MDRRLAPPDAIVVLGCRPGMSRRGQAALSRRAERAARAFHDHRCRAVIASGGRRWLGRAEAELLTDELVALGVPTRAIVRELCSLSTLENARYSAELLGAAGYRQPAVVTCDWHMPRALACFDWMGISAVGLCAVSPHRSASTQFSDFLKERSKRLLDRRTVSRWNGT